jgi:uncharacterized repeat protein (TIGR01451 family)
MAPVGTEVVFKAGVSDCDGSLLLNRRIEWGIAGAGHFTELGAPYQVGYFNWPWTLPRKIADNHAVGTTAVVESTLYRGTPDPNDDVPISRGEAWVTVSSACEGTSLVTAYAPSLENYNRVTTQIYWVDAQFIFPPPAMAEPGRPHVLTTTLLRRSDNAPLAGWTVRYDVAGGASLGYEGGNFVETRTDAAGRASVEVSPIEAGGGTTNVGISVYRPAAGGTPALGIGRGCTTITWGGAVAGVPMGQPSAAPSLPGPPAAPGAPAIDPYSSAPSLPPNFPYSPTTPSQVSPGPPSSAPSSGVPQSVSPPPSLPSTTGPATPPGQYQPPPGEAATGRPKLQVRLNLTTPAQVPVGDYARFEVVITNTGDGTARGVTIRDEFPAGLRHEKAQLGERSIFYNPSPPVNVAPNASTTIMLTFEVVAEGEQCHTVTVSAPDAEPVTQRGCVTGLKPSIASFRITGHRSRVVGEKAQFNISLKNGDSLTPDVQIVLKFPPELEPTGTLDPSHERLPDGSILLKLGDVGPSELRTFGPIEATCKSQSNNACVQAEVASGASFIDTHQACVEILPPAPAGTNGIFGP